MSPDERCANLGLLRDIEMQRARQEFVADGKYGLSSAIVHSLDGHVVVVRLDLHDEDQRVAIQRICLEHRAWFVQHVMEVWVATARLDNPAELAAQNAAKRAKTLDRLPGRTERLLYTDESIATPIRMWASDITRDGAGRAVLSEWRESELKLPSPGW